MDSVLPRCMFGAGTPYQCRRPGIGNPPLCQRHFAVAETINEEPEHAAEDPLGYALNILLRHPKITSFLDAMKDAVGQAASASDPHFAEWPPGRVGQASEPPPESPPDEPPKEDPRVVLGFSPTATLTRRDIKTRQRALAALYHPDAGGSEEAMKRLNLAADELLAQVA